MPRMDGLTLCKALRTEFNLKNTPIIMFSSLIDEQMKDKCRSVGATDQITKPEIHNLINMIDAMTFNKKPNINM
jgi:two-component system chemotaxis response regulator CheV